MAVSGSCPKCYPDNPAGSEKTMERTQFLKAAGYKVEAMWECDWKKEKAQL